MRAAFIISRQFLSVGTIMLRISMDFVSDILLSFQMFSFAWAPDWLSDSGIVTV